MAKIAKGKYQPSDLADEKRLITGDQSVYCRMPDVVTGHVEKWYGIHLGGLNSAPI